MHSWVLKSSLKPLSKLLFIIPFQIDKWVLKKKHLLCAFSYIDQDFQIAVL